MDIKRLKTSTLLLRYVLPQMIGLLFNSVYFIVDGVFIGRRLGADALAAAGVAVPVVEFTIALSMLISVGTGVLISSAAGRGDRPAALRVFNQSVAFTLGFALAIAALGGVFTAPLARALGAGEAILADTVTYLRVYLLFSPFTIFSFALSTYVRNDGRPSLAMWALTLGSLSNVLLDWVFMYPLGLGIGGAALATGLGPVFSVGMMLPHFLRRRGALHFARTRIVPRTLAGIFAAGLPAFIAEFSIGLVTLLYNLSIKAAGLGERGLAAYVIIGYAALICLSLFLGAAQGVQPVVSYCHGAGDTPRIRRLFATTSVFVVAVALGLYTALHLGGGAFYSLFAAGNAPLQALTGQIARQYFFNLPFAAFNILAISFIQAMEKPTAATALSLSRSTLPVWLCLKLLPMLLGTAGLWLALTGAEAFTALLALPLLVKALGKPREAAASPRPESVRN